MVHNLWVYNVTLVYGRRNVLFTTLSPIIQGLLRGYLRRDGLLGRFSNQLLVIVVLIDLFILLIWLRLSFSLCSRPAAKSVRVTAARVLELLRLSLSVQRTLSQQSLVTLERLRELDWLFREGVAWVFGNVATLSVRRRILSCRFLGRVALFLAVLLDR